MRKTNPSISVFCGVREENGRRRGKGGRKERYTGREREEGVS